ncbi:MAG: type I DNA topoisomerase [Microscillaceae bacterium]|jgi:DNA topoisomerase-1|nr:type I DNA topoisomerase [Microscillaceae bacterium]
MIKNLVIVESPAKAKTIEGYLGKDFTVKSSYGHVRDLPKNNDAIDIDNDFKPNYEISADKRQLISELKKLVKDTETVWLATDDDREGEAISWHLQEALDLKEKAVKRIVFREITKTAIQKAIQSPRDIDYDLVNAQQARRVLDRLVGFELSPLLWKKVKAGLSAGRVQSVAVRMIVEREREIAKFTPIASFRISAEFGLEKGKKLIAELPEKIENQAGAQDFLNKCIGAEFKVKNLETKPAKKSPAPPFTTSTLQQEASRKLRMSVSRTMRLAQNLYEAGKISYMRTDSTNLSEEAIGKAAEAIENNYGKTYVQTRRFKTKNESAQEAHEAIRPTDFNAKVASQDRDEQRLYELIWQRAIASQMADAQLERTTATIGINPILYNQNNKPVAMPDLLAKGEVIKFDGFLKVYLESTDDEEEEEMGKMLPPLTIGQLLDLNQMLATERFSRPSARFTEASLVKELEEMGIGRPSTYAPTISTIQERGYIVKEDREGKPRPYRELVLANNQIRETQKTEIVGTEKAKLFPTDIAGVVNDFLVKYFADVIDYHFTANIEEEFDKIAEGKKEWVEMIRKFYGGFHNKVQDTTKEAERASVNSTRILGKHPDNGLPVLAILGRYGGFIQIGETTENSKEKPPRASLQKNQRLETITLAEALELFKLPREVGEFEDKGMTVAIGRFGPYIRHDGNFYSLGKTDDPYSITEERAIEIIEAKRLADSQKLIKSFPQNPDVQVLNGRFGPYIKVGKENIKIPKGKKPEDLTLEECLELAEAKPEKASAKTSVKAENIIKSFAENANVQVLNGRYGPYIKIGKENIKIPKGKKAEDLTLQECLDLAGGKVDSGKKKVFKKK